MTNHVIVREIKIQQDETNKKKFYLMDGDSEVDFNRITKIYDIGAEKFIEGKVYASLNYIKIVPKGNKFIDNTNPNLKREFYNLYASKDSLIVAESLQAAEEIVNPEIVQETAEIELETESLIQNKNRRLNMDQKIQFKKKFEEEIQNTLEWKGLKTLKEKSIYLAEKEYPISAAAFILEKRFQQIRQYVVAFYGQNLKDLYKEQNYEK